MDFNRIVAGMMTDWLTSNSDLVAAAMFAAQETTIRYRFKTFLRSSTKKKQTTEQLNVEQALCQPDRRQNRDHQRTQNHDPAPIQGGTS